MLFRAVAPLAGGQMLYDPTTDPLWGEIKVLIRTPRAACRVGRSAACLLRPQRPAAYSPATGLEPPAPSLSSFSLPRTTSLASDARKSRACTTFAFSRSTSVLEAGQLCCIPACAGRLLHSTRGERACNQQNQER
jgi:hypothetical protein